MLQLGVDYSHDYSETHLRHIYGLNKPKYTARYCLRNIIHSLPITPSKYGIYVNM